MQVQQESENLFSNQTLGSVTDFIPIQHVKFFTAGRLKINHSEIGPTFYPQLRFTILREGPKRLRMIADVTEGIENLLYRAAANNGTFEGFMEDVKSKRYTWTRIQRMLTHIFTGFTYDIRSRYENPVLFTTTRDDTSGRLYLNEHKKRLKLPLVSKAAAFSNPSLNFRYPCSGYVRTRNRKRNFHCQIGVDYNTIQLSLSETDYFSSSAAK